ncbi:MAG TPA: ribokinase [Thermodesulfobacteriota bacterium]
MIVVFGSLNVDLIMRVGRLPGPGETVLCEEYVVRPGGKGNNQAVAAARAGRPVRLFGRVGRDDFARILVARLAENQVTADGVTPADLPTGCATIVVDDRGENVITVAAGANRSARADDVPDAVLGPDTTVVVQMEVPPAENWRLLERARRAGARTVLNTAPASLLTAEDATRLPGLVDVLVANEGEGALLAARLGASASADDPVRLARSLAERLGGACVVTLGSRGAVAAERGAAWRVGALPVRVADTTGAGDTFTGVLAAALDAGSDLREALHLASTAGSLACEAVGAQESMPVAAAIAARARDLAAPVPVE